ncbi:MAG: 42 kDa peptidyl-prolyl isomerase-like protein [Monoraphidium minutum]|nr:MAG: 42 kDa peptidyl-prolyl isomerase-like protein [Monoraphidium minutum]
MASCMIEDITDETPGNQRDPQQPAEGRADADERGGAHAAAGAHAPGAPADAAAAPSAAERPPMAPPEGCEQLTPDGGVLKLVLSEGSGDAPVLHARCLAHYVGYLPASGEVFLDTRAEGDGQEPAVLVAGRDSSLREAGLQIALSSMRVGERAAIYVTDPEYGYGKQGSFSFPCVPPGAALVYDVTLVAWEPPEEKLDRRGMLYEERLEAAERRRLEGNALFAEGKMVEALGKYAMALSYVDEEFLLQLEGPHLDRAEAVITPVHLNMAAAQIRLGDYATAVHNCGQVLARDRDNAKALFRRGRARAALGQTEDAVRDMEAAVKL